MTPGKYEIVVANSHREFARALVQYQGGAQTIEVPLKAIAPVLRVRGVDAHGTPMPVHGTILLRKNARKIRAMAETANGERILWIPGKTTSSDRLEVRSSHLGMVTIPGPHGPEVVAKFEQPCYLSITAPELPGPRKGWLIRIDGKRYSIQLDVLRLKARQPGPVRISLARRNQIVATVEHVLKSGPVRITAPTVPLAEFDVESNLGDRVRIEQQGGTRYKDSVSVDSSGLARFGWIPLGTYKVTGGEASAVFRVDRSGRFQLR